MADISPGVYVHKGKENSPYAMIILGHHRDDFFCVNTSCMNSETQLFLLFETYDP
ncbi:MAG: hypothetical protein KKB79_01255 [Nanoarchaeota archaeon]|nr:hypothetical protein [Nanoarchaeota archaeon]